MRARICWACGALALALSASGCNPSGLVSATGRLTYKGNPVPSTRVIFQPEDGSRRSTGLTDDDGRFTLQFSRTESGVKPGRHMVFVRYEVSAEEELGKIPPKASKELRAVITRNGDPKQSNLRFEVTESGQFFDVQLK
jgi:hypothetical protein